ncbi:MAG: cupin domain-containing protein [Rubripirellula sp.]
MSAKPIVVDLTALPGVDCPCGVARRAFAERPEFPGTVHLTEIHRDAREHYHKEHTEVYVILECEADAAIELDGVSHPVAPRSAILIPPGVRHRACGQMTVLILCTPNFDSVDEHFDPAL